MIRLANYFKLDRGKLGTDAGHEVDSLEAGWTAKLEVVKRDIAALEKRRATWKQALRNVLDDDTMNVNTQAEKIRRFKGALSVWLGLRLFCSVAWVGCGEPMGR